MIAILWFVASMLMFLGQQPAIGFMFLAVGIMYI